MPHSEKQDAPPASAGSRLLWFVAIWAASVLAVTLVSALLKALVPA